MQLLGYYNVCFDLMIFLFIFSAYAEKNCWYILRCEGKREKMYRKKNEWNIRICYDNLIWPNFDTRTRAINAYIFLFITWAKIESHKKHALHNAHRLYGVHNKAYIFYQHQHLINEFFMNLHTPQSIQKSPIEMVCT